MTKTFVGQLCLGLTREGYAEDILYLVNDGRLSDPVAEELKAFAYRRVTARYWITPERASKDEAIGQVLGTLDGTVDAKYGARYSEPTGYLWTDESGRIGGHDLLGELKSHLGKWLILEIEVHGEGGAT